MKINVKYLYLFYCSELHRGFQESNKQFELKIYGNVILDGWIKSLMLVVDEYAI